MRLPIQVAIHTFRGTARGREYLLLRRLQSDGGYWQESTGGVEEGESIEAAAVREFREETGIDPMRIEPIGFVYTHPVAPAMKLRHNFTCDALTVHVFAAEIASGIDPTIDPTEHDTYRWLALTDAIDLLYWAEDREAVRRVDAWLGARRREDMP